jgi:hypothetical protein
MLSGDTNEMLAFGILVDGEVKGCSGVSSIRHPSGSLQYVRYVYAP